MEMELLSLYFTKKVCNYIDNTIKDCEVLCTK